MNSYSVDINADLGEGIGNEEALLPYLSSCNIACGYHAGSTQEMNDVVDLAILHQVSIGAHPSYPDKANFGRLPMDLSDQELVEVISDQLYSLLNITKQKNTKLCYVKPHGALYHKTSTDPHTAELLIRTMQRIDPTLYLLGFAGSEMQKSAHRLNCPFAAEAFADRAYQSNGLLLSRSEPNAVHHTVEKVWQQVHALITEKKLVQKEIEIPIQAESICFHGDTPESIVLLKETYRMLQECQVNIKPFCS